MVETEDKVKLENTFPDDAEDDTQDKPDRDGND